MKQLKKYFENEVQMIMKNKFVQVLNLDEQIEYKFEDNLQYNVILDSANNIYKATILKHNKPIQNFETNDYKAFIEYWNFIVEDKLNMLPKIA